MRKNKRNENQSGLAVPAAWLVLAFVWPSLGFGDEAQGHKLAFKAEAGAVFRTDQNFDTGFLYGAGFFTLLSPRIGLELLITGNRAPMNEPPAGLSAGKLATTQVLLSGQYRFAKDGRFIPYAIFGLEFNFFHFWPADEAEENTADVVDRLAPHLGAGLDWALSDWLTLNADARYSIIKTWVEDLPREGPIGEVNPDEVDQISLNALTLTLGLKFFF
jgi:outer membrane protein W